MRDAEAAGFERAWSSDHFSPWSERQGESGFAWSWLGAAMQATAMPFGVVNAPGQRYHPAIVAQAAATLAELFPGRLQVALGTGEFSNEHITGEPWPRKAVRNARLRECVDVIRALFAGEVVDHDGLVTVDRARLWTLPAEPPPLLATAVSVETAAFAGEWADGLITINQPREHLSGCWRPSASTAARASRSRSRCTSRGRTPTRRRCGSRTSSGGPTSSRPRCPGTSRPSRRSTSPPTHVRPEDMHGPVLISSDLARHAAWIAEFGELGFDAVYLHHVGQEQQRFIAAFGEHVLPAL